MEKTLYTDPQEFQKDADEIFAVLYARGVREAAPLVQKFKEKYTIPKALSPDKAPPAYLPVK